MATTSEANSTAEALHHHRVQRTEWTRGGKAFLVRAGVASLFVINGLTALFRPEEFHSVVAANPILGSLPEDVIDMLVRSAVVHDFGIAFLLVRARHDRIAVLWMSAWMTAIAVTKATTFFWG